MKDDSINSILSPEKAKRLYELRNEFNVTWQYGVQDAGEVLNNYIASYLNNRFGREVVRKKDINS